MSKLLTVCKRSITEFGEDDCMSSGAAIAYYTIFSLPPLLVIVFMVADWFAISHERIDRVVKDQLGIPVAAASQNMASGESAGRGPLTDATQRTRESSAAGPLASLGWPSRVVGFLILLFSATSVLAQLQFALNKAWGVEPDPQQGGVKQFALKRVLSLGMVVVIAFLLLVSLVLTTLIDEIVVMIEGATPEIGVQAAMIALNNLAAVALATVLFAAMFKILPDAKMAWKDLWLGAAATGVLFVIGKNLISWYLQNSHVGNTWGSAAASMVGILVWVYYSSLIVLLGAEFTQSYADVIGNGIEPTHGAIRTVRTKQHVPDQPAANHPAYQP